MTSDHIKLEIEDGQHVREDDGYGARRQGINTIELDGTRLRVDGWFDGIATWTTEIELTDLQLQALRGTAGKLPFQPTKI